ncbi:iron-sulfur cluster assembly factor IBA57, mitochondrial-like [Crassostrea virginica]
MRLLRTSWPRVLQKSPISILCRCHKVETNNGDGISFPVKEQRTCKEWRSWKLYKMKSRGMIRLKGPDVLPFLQGLVTNDVFQMMGEVESMYTMMLNSQGRVLYDMIMHKKSQEGDDSFILMECDAEVTKEIISLFKKYKIRKKVDIAEVSDEFHSYAALPSERSGERLRLPLKEGEITLVQPDPRLEEFGWRIVARDQSMVMAGAESGSALVMGDEREYHIQRYQMGLPEGTLDLPPGNCLPLESNLVFHNGVSFTKGCYIGQELTARSFHTGVIRKRLAPIEFERVPEGIQTGVTIETADTNKNAGKYRNSVDRFGLGLIRLAEIKKRLLIPSTNGQNYNVKAHVPGWWPQEGEVTVQQ